MTSTAGKSHALIDCYGQHRADQWPALVDCYMANTAQASGTLHLAVMANTVGAGEEGDVDGLGAHVLPAPDEA